MFDEPDVGSEARAFRLHLEALKRFAFGLKLTPLSFAALKRGTRGQDASSKMQNAV